MVREIQHYYLSSKDVERGPYTLSQVASMWSSGALTASTLYRVTNVENWKPLSELDDTLQFISSSHPVQESVQVGASSQRPEDQPKGASSSPIGGKGNPVKLDVNGITFLLVAGRDARTTGPLDQLFGVGRWRFECGSVEKPQLLDGQIATLASCKVVTGGTPQTVWFRLADDSGLIGIERDLEQSAHEMGLKTLPSNEECIKIAKAFRAKWISVYLIFWAVLGFTGFGHILLWCVPVSVLILACQIQYKKRQLLRRQGLSDNDIKRRLEIRPH